MVMKRRLSTTSALMIRRMGLEPVILNLAAAGDTIIENLKATLVNTAKPDTPVC